MKNDICGYDIRYGFALGTLKLQKGNLKQGSLIEDQKIIKTLSNFSLHEGTWWDSISYMREYEYGVYGIFPVIVDEREIKYFFSHKGSTGREQISNTDVGKLLGAKFNPSLESVFIIHGWLNNHLSTYNLVLGEALRKNHDVNIFDVDWSRYSFVGPLTVLTTVGEVGAAIANFIRQLEYKFNVKPNQVRLVGASLGSHIAAFVGKSLNGQLASIVGLDPSGIGFYQHIPSGRLNPGDAQYVQVIHTNSGILGVTFPLGHSDFWVNGGVFQPDCLGRDLLGLCSHSRAFEVYVESLGTNRLLGTKCDSYLSYKQGACEYGETSYMGGLHPNTTARGNYHLITNHQPPYGRN